MSPAALTMTGVTDVVTARPDLGAGADLITVTRAWPRPRDGELLISFEGRDRLGRVRAGLWTPGEARARVLPPGQDPAIPRPPGQDLTGELLVHRYKRRMVLRRNGSGASTEYVKLLAGDRAGRVAEVSAALAPVAAAAGFQVAPLTLRPGRVIAPALSGTTLTRWAATSSKPQRANGWAAAWLRWQEVWPVFAGGRAALPHWTVADECATLDRWLADLLRLRPPDDAPMPHPPSVRARARAATDALRALPEITAVPAHRDLHDGQLLWDGAGRLGLLDLDTGALADPALDLANLLTHLEWLHRLGHLDDAPHRTAHTAITTVAGELGVDAARLAAWSQATRLRICAVHAFRPGTRQAAYRWLGELTG